MTSRNRSRAFVLAAVAAALLLVSVAPSTAEAQRRSRRSGPVVVIGGYSYFNYWRYDPWYQWGPRGYPPYGYGIVDRAVSLRIDGEPRQAQVFVDGYYAGLVDDFDGVFQRLRLEPGGRTITIYLEGYRTEQQRLYLRPGADQRIRLTMQPLGPGEQSVPPSPPREEGTRERDDPSFEGGLRGVEPGMPDVAPAARFGTLALRVQPADAEVIIDGDRWNGPAGQELMTIQLPEGRHRVEVRSPGLAAYTEEVLIGRDRTLTLNVSLR